MTALDVNERPTVHILPGKRTFGDNVTRVLGSVVAIIVEGFRSVMHGAGVTSLA